MKNVAFIFGILALIVGGADARAEELTLNGKILSFVKMDSVLVSKDCESNHKCLSLAALHDKAPLPSSLDAAGFEKLSDKEKKKRKLKGVHPASEFCFAKGGRNYVLENEKKDQVDVCKFTDNSMIDSWDLYYAHHKRSQVE